MLLIALRPALLLGFSLVVIACLHPFLFANSLARSSGVSFFFGLGAVAVLRGARGLPLPEGGRGRDAGRGEAGGGIEVVIHGERQECAREEGLGKVEGNGGGCHRLAGMGE